jgi:hypothetical protein
MEVSGSDCSQKDLPSSEHAMAPAIKLPSDKWDEIKEATFDYENVKVVEMKDLKKICPGFFVGCSASDVQVIKKRNIPESGYFMVHLEKVSGKYKPTVEGNSRRTYLIKLDHLEKEHLLLTGTSDKVPPILHLEDKEKFKDANGQIMEVEVRGKRKRDSIFYKVNDIGTVLEHNDLKKTLSHANSAFELGLHYVHFMIDGNETPFLTHRGLIKAIHAVRSGTSEVYQEWISKIMFTVDYGDEEAKMKLTSLLLGISIEVLAQFCSGIYVGGMPGIYLFLVGYAYALRGELNIPDDIPADWIICKFGRTIELIRRAKEHKRSFKRSIDVCLDKYTGFEDVNDIIKDFPDIRLLKYAHIDPRNITEAEKMIKQRLRCRVISFENQKEIIAIHPGDLVLIEDIFDTVKNKCAGGIEELEGMLEQERRNTEQERQNTEQERLKRQKLEAEIVQLNLRLEEKELRIQDKNTELAFCKDLLLKK